MQYTSISLYTPDGVSLPVTVPNNNSYGFPELTALAVTPGNKLLFSNTYQLMQLNADGSLDTTFGVNGTDVLPIAGLSFTATVQSMSILPNGTPVVAIDHINDTIRSGLISVDERPNLTLTGLTVNDGAALDVTVQSSIRGNLVGHSPALRLVLSTDTVLGNGDDVVLKNATPTTPTDSEDYVLSTTGIADGSYNLFAVLDPDNALSESDETDNVLMTLIVLTHSDLSVSLTATATKAFLGRGLPVSSNINASDVPINTYVEIDYVLSTDTLYGNSDDHVFSSNGGFNIPSGTSPDYGFSTTAPSDLPTGMYYILAAIDPQHLIRDPNFSNNITVGPRLLVNAPFDLNIAALSYPSTINSGNSLHVAITPGGTPDYNSPIHFSLELSLDTIIGNADDVVIASGSPNFSYLPTDGSTSIDVPIDDYLPTGDYHLFAFIANSDPMRPETNPTNDVTMGPIVHINSSQPAPASLGDANVNNLTVLGAGVPGNPDGYIINFDLYDNLYPFVPIPVSFYASSDDSTPPELHGVLIGTQTLIPTSVLDPGHFTFTVNNAPNLPTGAYDVFVEINTGVSPQDFAETDGKPLVITAPIVTPPPPPPAATPAVADLRSSLSSLSVSTKTLKTATTAFTLSNAGNAATSGPVNVTYVLSTSPNFADAVYTFPVQHYTASLASGGSKSFPLTLTLPPVRKTGSYYIVAHPLSSDSSDAGDDLSNNDSASTAIKLTGPNVVLKASLGAFSKGQQTITLTNKGNDPAKDRVEVLLQTAPHKFSQGATSFTPFFKTLNLQPGKSITFSVRASGTVVHGSKFLIASIFYPFDNLPASAILFSAKPVKFN